VAQAKIMEMEKTGVADVESEDAQKAEKEKAVKLKEGKGKKKGGKGGKSTPKDAAGKGQSKTDKELEKQVSFFRFYSMNIICMLKYFTCILHEEHSTVLFYLFFFLLFYFEIKKILKKEQKRTEEKVVSQMNCVHIHCLFFI
jgi:hypothetical protein